MKAQNLPSATSFMGKPSGQDWGQRLKLVHKKSETLMKKKTRQRYPEKHQAKNVRTVQAEVRIQNAVRTGRQIQAIKLKN